MSDSFQIFSSNEPAHLESNVALYFMIRDFFYLLKLHDLRGDDKIRNMEHPGAFRNIPEHEKIKIFFTKKNCYKIIIMK